MADTLMPTAMLFAVVLLIVMSSAFYGLACRSLRSDDVEAHRFEDNSSILGDNSPPNYGTFENGS